MGDAGWGSEIICAEEACAGAKELADYAGIGEAANELERMARGEEICVGVDA
jgi:hypothetical protein